MPKIYLDHLSTTPLSVEVFEAMRPYLEDHFGNPSSLHHHGLIARDALEKARAQASAFLGAESPDEIIFTSGGTEAINLAIKGAAYANRRRGNHIVTSTIEHPAVLGSIGFLEKQGFAATRVGVDGEGFLDPARIEAALTEETILVGTHLANHEIGTIQPVQSIGRMARDRGLPFFVDATASAGWLPLNVQEMGADLVALAPHRFYGPKGVGILYRNRRARLEGLLQGGNQEGGRRAGTENVPAIVGAGMAAEIAGRELDERASHVARLQKCLWEGLKSQVSYLRLNGPALGPRRLPINLNLSVEFVEGEGLLLRLDMNGMAVASGSSCLSKALQVSHVLSGIGLEHSLARGSVLISPGKGNTEEEIETFIAAFQKTVAQLREMSPQWEEFKRGTADSLLGPSR
jgi:cysteine desulfurase